MATLSPADHQFLEAFYRSVMDAPLKPGDERYVPLYEMHDLQSDDPVMMLERTIRYSDDSVQLLAGFRGVGKSTELLRLQKQLEDAGTKVVKIDIDNYINMSTPIDISDFLMSVTGAFGVALEEDKLLGKNGLLEGVWERFRSFLGSIQLAEFSAEVAAKGNAEVNVPGMKKSGEVSAKLGLKGSFKEDPTFKARVQKQMEGHLHGLVAEVRKFFEACRKALQDKYEKDTKIVLIVDSIEHIRGTFTNAQEVQASIENLFAMHSEELRIPGVHAIYTIPPFLKIRYPNLGCQYPVGAVQMFPAIKVKRQKGEGATAGVYALLELVKKRHPEASRLMSDEQYKRVIEETGGHLRDLLRTLAEVIRRVMKPLPADDGVLTRALNQMRNESLPIANNDAVWLARIARTGKAELEDQANLVQMSRFFDTNLVMCYRNGHEWFDVHPLIREHVLEQADEVAKRKAAKDETSTSDAADK